MQRQHQFQARALDRHPVELLQQRPALQREHRARHLLVVERGDRERAQRLVGQRGRGVVRRELPGVGDRPFLVAVVEQFAPRVDRAHGRRRALLLAGEIRGDGGVAGAALERQDAGDRSPRRRRGRRGYGRSRLDRGGLVIAASGLRHRASLPGLRTGCRRAARHEARRLLRRRLVLADRELEDLADRVRRRDLQLHDGAHRQLALGEQLRQVFAGRGLREALCPFRERAALYLPDSFLVSDFDAVQVLSSLAPAGRLMARNCVSVVNVLPALKPNEKPELMSGNGSTLPSQFSSTVLPRVSRSRADRGVGVVAVQRRREAVSRPCRSRRGRRGRPG